jgi:glycine/D-amino acid oxidase-like deaminating enzyme
MSPHTNVAVVGGGVLGSSIAANLADRGADVTLITKGQLGDGASGRSLSWLNSFSTRNPAYHQLRLLGIDRYRTLAARNPDIKFVRFDGGLAWAAPGDTAQREAFRHLQAVGYDAHWLSPDEVASWTPGVDPTAIPAEGAIFSPGEGWVDLPSLIALLAQRLSHSGGKILENQGEATVEVTAGRVTAVDTPAGGRLPVDAVVLATGPDVPAAAAAVGVHIPDGTTPALLARTTPIAHPLKAVLNTPNVAIRPTPTGSFCLDSAWSEAELTKTDGTYTPRPDTVQRLLQAGSAVLQGNPTLTLESVGIGLKPIPGDGEPVVGALPGIPGYHVAFTHSGATLGLILGELLAREVMAGERTQLLNAFRPERFA